MCARFSLTATPRDLRERFVLLDLEDFPPRYNIAPTQPILVVAAGEGGAEAGSNRPDRRALLVRWGFLPSWLKDTKGFPLLINARSETAAEKNTFRAAMRHRRILVPASGFYEWKRDRTDKRARPEAYWVRPAHGDIVAFGGLMETWSGPDGSEIDTAAILTTRASPDLAGIHPRMPVVIRPEDFARWLDCRTQEPRDVADLTEPVEQGFFEAVAVSDKVNSVANAGPELQRPVPRPAAGRAAEKADGKPAGGQLKLF